MIRRLLSFAAPYWTELTLAGLLGLLAVVCNIGLLAIAAYLLAAAALKPLLLALSLPLYIVQAAGVGRSITRYAERLVSHSVTLRVMARVRSWLFTRVLPLAPGNILAFRSGDLLARLIKDLEELEHVYIRGLAPIVIAGVVTLGTVGVLAAWQLSLGATALLFLIVAGCALPWVMAQLLRGAETAELSTRARLHTHVIDGVQGMADLQAFGAVPQFSARLTAIDAALDGLRRGRALIGGLHQGVLVLLAGLATLALLIVAVPLVRSGALPPVYLAALVLIIAGAFESVGSVGTAVLSLGRARAAGERLFQIAEMPAMVSDPLCSQPIPRSGQLRFVGVNFAYSGDQPLVLESIELTLRSAGRVAIVGASGSGKSTIARLAMRSYDPTAGTVFYGGHSLASYRLGDVRSAIAVVPQNPYIFTDTLRRNIVMGRPTATDAEVQAAICAACLDSVVAGLPAGLDTWIGSEGAFLSGGERQRVALARALVARPQLLILDEATANLDTLTERAVLHNIMESMRDRAVLVITHRLVDLNSMDEIIVLDRGRIIERGSHAVLVGRGGLYRAMLETQNELLAHVPDVLLRNREPITSRATG